LGFSFLQYAKNILTRVTSSIRIYLICRYNKYHRKKPLRKIALKIEEVIPEEEEEEEEGEGEEASLSFQSLSEVLASPLPTLMEDSDERSRYIDAFF
jgi:hypothetical protein